MSLGLGINTADKGVVVELQLTVAGDVSLSLIHIYGLPVVGATIIVEDPSNIRTITDNNGNFQLSDVSKDSRVRISYVGLETQFLHPSSYMSVVMKSDTRALDEVVVTGMRCV